ncbi:MAG TPA: 5-deoxy-glucuronate isomerase [Firmicutes bacterium]|nr:5-deoxy-glucuronate isomerase [Bacillota bacterium]
MGLVYSARGVTGLKTVVDARNSPLEYLSLDKLCLSEGGCHEGSLGDEEAILVILGGKCSINLRRDGAECSWSSLGSRPNPFAGNPAAVYIPRAWKYSIGAISDLEALVARSPWPEEAADEGDSSAIKPVLIRPEDVRVVSVGAGNWRRDVRFILGPESSVSRRLIVAETLNPPGNWSGFPPHKHDTRSDTEVILEEIYHFKVSPRDSYGIQRVYGYEGSDDAYVVHDDDVVIFPGGYHPTVAPPGTTLCYFWAIAGAEKAMKVTIDPRYRWISLAEGIIKEMQKAY